MDRGAVPRTSTNKLMKLLKFKAVKEYESNEYLFKYKNHYLFVKHSLLINRKTVCYSYIHFGDNASIVSTIGSTVAYCYSTPSKIRLLSMSHKPYYFDPTNEDMDRIYIKNKISDNNLSKRKVLRECFDIYEVFTQKI